MAVNPLLWSGTPYKNSTAMLDFAGTYELWVRDLAMAIHALNGASIRVFPVGTPGGPEWMEAVQRQNIEAANALGMAPPGDLSTYDLNDPIDHASWFFQLSNYSNRLRQAAGLP